MFKKSFVAVYILPEVIYVISLSSDRKEVSVSAKLDLPKGLIKNYKVVDTNLFAQVLAKLWKTYSLHERAVAIVLSEFAAYTKVLPIATNQTLEMHEAVLWASQDFLPDELDAMLLDWKIVKQKPNGSDVFVVAARSAVVQSYTDSFEKAGLLPMYVEIPSLSLARLAKDTEKGSVIVYGHPNASIVVFAYDGVVLGSSVVNGQDQAEIVSTVKKIVNHYKAFPPTKLFVGGAVEKAVPELEKLLGIKSHVLDLPVKTEATSEFLIPLSLSTATLTEPSDTSTINLLPQSYVEKYRSSKEKVQFWGLILTVTLFVWISLFSVLATYLFMTQAITALSNSTSQKADVTKQRDASIASVKQINAVADNVLNIKKVTINTQEILNLIVMSKPEGIEITGYDMDFDSGMLEVQGLAVSRVALIEFKQNLEKSENIGTVDIPISSFERETNLEFRLTAEYQPITKTLPQKGQQQQRTNTQSTVE